MPSESEGFAPEPGPGLFPELPRETPGGRCMLRYEVPADGKPHTFTLTGDPRAVAAPDVETVEFWAERVDLPGSVRAFRVFGTGDPLPADAVWVGTCLDAACRAVHLYEVTP